MEHMPAPDTRPSFTIGEAVTEIARTFPDITHSALRFLEREGLIAAQRTPGGHRMYSAGDIARVLQIRTWQQQHLPLIEIRDLLARQDQMTSSESLMQAFLQQVIAGDLHVASRTIRETAEVGMPLADLFEQVLVPALVEVGNRWATGEILVAQEKEISELVRELVVELSLRHARPLEGQPSFVAGCVAGEKHELGLRMICGLLRARGCTVHFLGADVDTRFLLQSVELRHPDALLLSARAAESLPAIRDAIEQVGDIPEGDRPCVIVGGHVVVDHGGTIESWGAITIQDQHISTAVEHIARRYSGPEQR
jgi:methanogenic corrinoid protein MtbC1